MSHSGLASRAALAGILALAATAVAGADSTSTEGPITPPGAPHYLTIAGAAGVAADSAVAAEFWNVFRKTFIDQGFLTEKPGAREGRFTVSVPLINRFVLLEGSSGPWAAESYRVSLEIVPLAPAPRDTAPRAAVITFTVPPGADPALVRVPAQADTIRFEGVRRGAAPAVRVIARNAALLVAERVHRLAGELPPEERVQLDGARRWRDRH